MMIKDLYENKFGDMVGTFYSDIFGYDIQVWYKKGLPSEYVEKNIQYLNNLDKNFLVSICAAVKRYYEYYKTMFPDLCEEIPENIIKDYEENPTSILKYLDIGTYTLDEYNLTDGDVPVINLGGDCAWAGDEGITIAAKNNKLLYVGPWKTFNVWTTNVGSGRLERMFNYAQD